MPYPPKSPEKRGHTGFGVSLDRLSVTRIDALADLTYPNVTHGKRSQFVRDLLELGLSQRFGPNWRQFADRLREEQSPADAELVPA